MSNRLANPCGDASPEMVDEVPIGPTVASTVLRPEGSVVGEGVANPPLTDGAGVGDTAVHAANNKVAPTR